MNGMSTTPNRRRVFSTSIVLSTCTMYSNWRTWMLQSRHSRKKLIAKLRMAGHMSTRPCQSSASVVAADEVVDRQVEHQQGGCDGEHAVGEGLETARRDRGIRLDGVGSFGSDDLFVHASQVFHERADEHPVLGVRREDAQGSSEQGQSLVSWSSGSGRAASASCTSSRRSWAARSSSSTMGSTVGSLGQAGVVVVVHGAGHVQRAGDEGAHAGEQGLIGVERSTCSAAGAG